MNDAERTLRDAVKNARSAFYKNKGKQKKQSRKEARKTKRLEKKAKQHMLLSKKNIVDEVLPNPITSQSHEKKKHKRKKKKKTMKNETEDEFDYKRYAYEAANRQDEKIISSLGKKLKATIQSDNAKCFKDDGLDFILEVCEPLTKDFNVDDSDEEYLAAKKNKSPKKTNKKDTEKYGDTINLSEKDFFDDGTHKNKPKQEYVNENAMEGDEILSGEELSDSDSEVIEVEEEDVVYDEEKLQEKDNVDDELEELDGENDKAVDDVNDMDQQTGSVIKEKIATQGKYVPPALRKLKQSNEDQDKIKRERLQKQLKGLLNRLSGSTLHYVTNELEVIYSKNSRNIVNELLYGLLFDSLITNAIMAERFIMEHAVIIGTLQATTSSEIGTYALQLLVEKFNQLHQSDKAVYNEGKQCQNIITVLCYFYLLKMVDSLLIYDIIRQLAKKLREQDIEMVLIILKVCGPEIRKDDPAALKDVILEIQAQAMTSDLNEQSRVRFMLETINALKNNNMRKIQNHDSAVLEDGRKFMKALLKGKDCNSPTPLKVSLVDLLSVKEKGKWWVVGSAWAGRGPVTRTEEHTGPIIEQDSKLLVIAKKQHMNTNLRKDIFCAIMTSEDYMDAFERLLKLNLKEKQAREIIHVLLDCCLQEKVYNPFYAHLADKFCDYSHSHRVTLQYSLWDRFKIMPTLAQHNKSNMALLLAHLVASKSLSLGVLKVVSFGVLDKQSIKVFIHFFKILLLQYPESVMRAVFQRISGQEKLSLLREAIKVFLRHFLTPKKKPNQDAKTNLLNRKINELIEIAESALDGRDYTLLQ